MSRTEKTISARDRARQAKARRDAARAERDRQIEKLATDFYRASDEVEACEEALASAQLAKATTVAGLVAIGEQTNEVAELCGITASEVRALVKAAKAAEDAAAPETDSDPLPDLDQ